MADSGRSQIVSNGSFEQPGRASDQYTVTFGSLPTNYITGWLLGASGVAYGNGHAYGGICGGSGFTGGNYEDGTNCIFLQGGMAATTVTLTPGTYTLSFWALGRNAANGANPVAATVGNGGGIISSNTVTPGLSAWTQYLFNFTASASGTYQLTFQATIPYGSGGDHTTFIDNVSIVPGAIPPSFTSQPTSEEMVYAGGAAHFSASVAGSPTPTCRWQIESNGVFVNLSNNSRISGATTTTLTISNLIAADATNYLLQASNSAATTNSSSAQLVVLPAPAGGSYDSAVLADNPVAYYPLNETTDPSTGTAVACDFAGGFNGNYGTSVLNGFDGTVGPRPSDGFPNFSAGDEAALFPSPSGEITLAPWELNTNTVTFTAWIYPIGVQNPFAGLIYIVGGADGSGFNFCGGGDLDTNGNSTLGYTWNFDGGTYGWNSLIAPPQSQWSFVALVVAPTEVTVYIINTNGVLIASQNHAHPVEPFAASAQFGFFPGQPNNDAFNGSMNHVAVFAQALSSNQIVTLYDTALSAHNCVTNGSFETVTSSLASSTYTTSFGSLPTNAVSNWSFGASAGNAYDGIVTSGGFGVQVIEDGSNAAFIQGAGFISQSVALSAGPCNLSFYAMGRTSANGGNGADPITVTVGSLLNQTFTPGNAAEDNISDWTMYNYDFTVSSAGMYTLQLSGNDPYVSGSDDHMTIIDNVSILAIASVPPPTITSEPSPQQVLYVGQSAQFTVQSTGASPLTYQWRVESNGVFFNLANGGRISGATNSTLIISNLNLGDSTNYQVSLANAGGMTNSTIAALAVLATPPPGSPRSTVTVINPSFEDGQVTNDTYTTGSGTLDPQTGVPGWQFSSSGGDSFSGIVTESGTLFGTPKYIPQCWQAAFVQGTGQFSQSVAFESGGTNLIRFRAVGRSSGGAGAEPITVSVDGNVLGTFTPLTTAWSLYTSLPFSVGAGVHVVGFAGTVPYSVSDRTSFVDSVEIVSPAEAAAIVPPASPVYNIVFVGDSITYGATLANPATQASAVQCMQSLGSRFNMGVRMSNQGHSGATTVDWLPGSSYFQGAVSAAAALESSEQGQLIFSIMLGANDSAQSGTDGAPVSATNFLANLQSIVSQFLADYTNAYVFVHYPTWYSTNTHNGAVYDAPGLARLQTYFPEIDQLVSNYAVTLPGHVFAGDKLAFNNFSNNYLTELTPESGVEGTFYLHPNALGATVLGGFWANAIVAPLNVAANDSYVEWLQSCDLTPGAPGTRFSDKATNSLVNNGVAYGNPNGLIATFATNSLGVFADVRNDTNLTVVLQASTNLINWNPAAWPIAPGQSGVATGFIRHAVQVPVNSLQQENFYRLMLQYWSNY